MSFLLHVAVWLTWWWPAGVVGAIVMFLAFPHVMAATSDPDVLDEIAIAFHERTADVLGSWIVTEHWFGRWVAFAFLWTVWPWSLVTWLRAAHDVIGEE